jgi:hypothetical protein
VRSTVPRNSGAAPLAFCLCAANRNKVRERIQAMIKPRDLILLIGD